MCCRQVLVLFMNKINLELDHTRDVNQLVLKPTERRQSQGPNNYVPLEQSRDQSVPLKYFVCFHSLNEGFVREIPMVLVINSREGFVSRSYFSLNSLN